MEENFNAIENKSRKIHVWKCSFQTLQISNLKKFESSKWKCLVQLNYALQRLSMYYFICFLCYRGEVALKIVPQPTQILTFELLMSNKTVCYLLTSLTLSISLMMLKHSFFRIFLVDIALTCCEKNKKKFVSLPKKAHSKITQTKNLLSFKRKLKEEL